jgi:hypothetical protein
MIQVFINNMPELKYIADLLLNDFLGVEYNLRFHDKNYIRIVLNNGSEVVVEDHFFSIYKDDYLKKENIPSAIRFLKDNFTKKEEVPVIFGFPEITEKDGTIICRADLFAGAFFMLSRWEEHVIDSVDSHNRFLSANSLAVKHGFVEKPLVNQYVELLFTMLFHQDCSVERKKMDFQIEVSHDVDIPFMFQMYPFERALKKVLYSSLKKKNPFHIYRGLKNWIEVRKGNIKKDPFYTFEKIIEISDRFSLKSTFYFLTGIEKGGFNGHYDINDSAICDLLSFINQKGHKIGLHASYRSYDSEELLKEELAVLKKTLSKLSIEQDKIGSRQHFLRWKTPETFQNLENAGIDHDSTMSYPDRAGFRCGTCHPYRVFNIKTRKTLNLVEHPLIVMDCTLTAKRYMNLSMKEALEKALLLKSECRKYNGIFSLLWHNTEFADDEKIKLYMEIIRG